MFKKCVCAAVVLVLCMGVALADEFGAIISKVGDGKVTFSKFKFNKDTKKPEKGADETLPVAADVKVTTGGTFNKETKKLEGGEAVKDGLKNELFGKSEKGVFGRITTDADGKKITAIHVMQRKGKDK